MKNSLNNRIPTQNLSTQRLILSRVNQSFLRINTPDTTLRAIRTRFEVTEIKNIIKI